MIKMKKQLELRKKEIIQTVKDDITATDLLNIAQGINSWDGGLEEYDFHDMEFFDELFCDKSPLEILDSVDKDFNTMDKYFKDTMYGLESMTSYAVKCELESIQDEIITVFIDNLDEYFPNCYFDNSEMKELFKELQTITDKLV